MQDRGTRAPAKDWYDLVVQTIALKGMTKTQLAERAGVSRATIDRWERGASRPAQAASVNAVADALGIPRVLALRLAGVISDTPETDRSPPRELPADLQELMRKRLGDEVASRLIAHYAHLVSGRTPPAEGADRRREPDGEDRRTAG